MVAWIGLAASVITNIVGMVMINYVFANMKAYVAGNIFLLEGVFALVIGRALYSEVPGARELFGAAFGDMLTLAISRGGVLSAAILSHHFFISFFTYVALSIQILSMCFFLFGMYRIALYSNLASFCLVFVLFDLNQVVIGMLFFFTFFGLRDIPYIHAFYKKLRA
jgi:hypothetical protein